MKELFITTLENFNQVITTTFLNIFSHKNFPSCSLPILNFQTLERIRASFLMSYLWGYCPAVSSTPMHSNRNKFPISFHDLAYQKLSLQKFNKVITTRKNYLLNFVFIDFSRDSKLESRFLVKHSFYDTINQVYIQPLFSKTLCIQNLLLMIYNLFINVNLIFIVLFDRYFVCSREEISDNFSLKSCLKFSIEKKYISSALSLDIFTSIIDFRQHRPVFSKHGFKHGVKHTYCPSLVTRVTL